MGAGGGDPAPEENVQMASGDILSMLIIHQRLENNLLYLYISAVISVFAWHQDRKIIIWWNKIILIRRRS